MDVYEAISQRRSIRRYKPDPVGQEQLTRVLEAARLAPSWKNQQCWRYVVITEETGKIGVAAACADTNPGKNALKTAPVVVVLCANPQASGIMGDRLYYMVDCGITMEHLVLAAKAEGLATCWIGAFDEETAKTAVGAPADWRVVAMTPLGYPDHSPSPTPRRDVSDVFRKEKWDGKGV